MQTEADKFDTFINKLKSEGRQIPCLADKKLPHHLRISVASGVNKRFFQTTQGRRKLNLAIQEIGLDLKRGALAAKFKQHAEENTELVALYLQWLEESGLRLPENPTRRGTVFFEQLKVEAGLPPRSLDAKGVRKKGGNNCDLVKMIEGAVPRLGLEVRVLTLHVGQQHEQLTYETLLRKGTEERARELEGKPSARQQLYNTQTKLRLFCEVLGLDLNTPIGEEFVKDFEKSVDLVFDRIKNDGSRSKFQTEIRRWSDYYRRLIKAASLPEDFHDAFRHLVNMSRLPYSILGKLLGLRVVTVGNWYKGESTPSRDNLVAVSRMEAFCKLPAGALVSRLPEYCRSKRITLIQLPEFLTRNVSLANRVCRHLPANFLELPPEKQKEIFESIQNNVLRRTVPQNMRQAQLQRLPYAMKNWPEAPAREFEELALFQTAERPPIGMKRKRQWRAESKEMARATFSYLFGALTLPADAADVRVRGLGLPADHLTLALIACPLVVDWFIRFRCEARTQYTSHALKQLGDFVSLLRAGTGWLRQMPEFAKRLRPISLGRTVLVSPELISRAHNDWDGVCQAAVEHYRGMYDEIRPLIQVSRNPFAPIKGVLKMNDPMNAFDLLLQGMRDDLPNLRTQPSLYHTAIRDCALVALITVTGFRRNTIAQLDYTGDEAGHLILEGDSIVLDVPRPLFKEPDSPFFGPKNAQSGYSNRIPNVFRVVDIFSEYLSVSRPFLLSNNYADCEERPLFVTSGRSKAVRVSPNLVSAIYRGKVEKHLTENIWRGTGIRLVWPTGPHSARYIRGTAIVKKTGSFKLAADANQHTEETAKRCYAIDFTEDQNQRVNNVLFGNRIR